MPSEAEDILAEAKKAIDWLRGMAVSDTAARRSWATLSRLLQLAAQKVGGDASEILAAPLSQLGETQPFGPTMQHPPPAPSGHFDPNDWQPLDNYYTSHFFGDQGASEYDQYGFFTPGGGAPILFPSSAELGGPRGEQGTEGQGQNLWPGGQDPLVGGWYGQFERP